MADSQTYEAYQNIFRGNFIRRLTVDYKTNEVIFWEGDEAEFFYIILEGKVKIRRRKTDGNPVVLAVLSQGQFFGEMALLNQLPRTGTAIAVEKTKLLVLTSDQLLSLISKNSSFALKMIKMLCERLKSLGDTLVQV